MHTVKIGNFEVGAGNPLVLLAGPCVLESYERSLYIGKTIKEITSRLGIPYVFKLHSIKQIVLLIMDIVDQD